MNNDLNYNKTKYDVKVISRIGLMAAIICIATMVIKIPTGLAMGYVHLGDSMVYVAVLFGKRKGAVSAALGMGLADLFLGYAYYIPFTVAIKAVMAIIVAHFVQKDDDQNNLNFAGFLLGGFWMVGGYFIAKVILAKYILMKADSISAALVLGFSSIPGNIVQFVVGMAIAIPILKGLRGKIDFR